MRESWFHPGSTAASSIGFATRLGLSQVSRWSLDMVTRMVDGEPPVRPPLAYLPSRGDVDDNDDAVAAGATARNGRHVSTAMTGPTSAAASVPRGLRRMLSGRPLADGPGHLAATLRPEMVDPASLAVSKSSAAAPARGAVDRMQTFKRMLERTGRIDAGDSDGASSPSDPPPAAPTTGRGPLAQQPAAPSLDRGGRRPQPPGPPGTAAGPIGVASNSAAATRDAVTGDSVTGDSATLPPAVRRDAPGDVVAGAVRRRTTSNWLSRSMGERDDRAGAERIRVGDTSPTGVPPGALRYSPSDRDRSVARSLSSAGLLQSASSTTTSTPSTTKPPIELHPTAAPQASAAATTGVATPMVGRGALDARAAVAAAVLRDASPRTDLSPSVAAPVDEPDGTLREPIGSTRVVGRSPETRPTPGEHPMPTPAPTTTASAAVPAIVGRAFADAGRVVGDGSGTSDGGSSSASGPGIAGAVVQPPGGAALATAPGAAAPGASVRTVSPSEQSGGPSATGPGVPARRPAPEGSSPAAPASGERVRSSADAVLRSVAESASAAVPAIVGRAFADAGRVVGDGSGTSDGGSSSASGPGIAGAVVQPPGGAALATAPGASVPGASVRTASAAERSRPSPGAAAPAGSLPTALPSGHPGRPSPAAAFDAALRSGPAIAARPLPEALRPLAAAIVGHTAVTMRTDHVARRALTAAGKRAATTGSVIHLQRTPDARVDRALLAHELTHVAHPSATPRFFDDVPSTEERRADDIAALVQRLPAFLPARRPPARVPAADEPGSRAGSPTMPTTRLAPVTSGAATSGAPAPVLRRSPFGPVSGVARRTTGGSPAIRRHPEPSGALAASTTPGVSPMSESPVSPTTVTAADLVQRMSGPQRFTGLSQATTPPDVLRRTPATAPVREDRVADGGQRSTTSALPSVRPLSGRGSVSAALPVAPAAVIRRSPTPRSPTPSPTLPPNPPATPAPGSAVRPVTTSTTRSSGPSDEVVRRLVIGSHRGRAASTAQPPVGGSAVAVAATAVAATGQSNGASDGVANATDPLSATIADLRNASGVVDFVDWIVEQVEDRLLSELQRRGGRFRGEF